MTAGLAVATFGLWVIGYNTLRQQGRDTKRTLLLAKATVDLARDEFIKGTIVYSDARGIKRETRFMRTYDDAIRRFIRSEDPDEEYAD